MNAKTHRLGCSIQLALKRPAINREQGEVAKSLLSAIESENTATACENVKLAVAWRRFYQFVENTVSDVQGSVPLFVTDSWFLRDVILTVTTGRDEEAAYLTGPTMGNVRILSRICKVALAEQSPVYARGDGKSCADALIHILERGLVLQATAHSHPGTSTTPSGIDLNTLGEVQKHGSSSIGLIVVRSGHCRFFTATQPFRTLVLGAGVQQLEENLYHVDLD